MQHFECGGELVWDTDSKESDIYCTTCYQFWEPAY